MNGSPKKYTVIKDGKYSGCRLYEDVQMTSIDIFYSEWEAYLNSFLDNGLHLYYIFTEPKHEYIFSESDISYINDINSNLDWKIKHYAPLDFEFSDTLKNIKNLQYEDFKLLFTSLDIALILLIPCLSKSNKFYYELMLCFKNPDEINKFKALNLNLIKITDIVEVKKNSPLLEFDYLKHFIHLEETIYTDNMFSRTEGDIWRTVDDSDFPYKIYTEKMLKKLCFHLYHLKEIEFTGFCFGFIGVVDADDVVSKYEPYGESFLDLILNSDKIPLIIYEIEKIKFED